MSLIELILKEIQERALRTSDFYKEDRTLSLGEIENNIKQNFDIIKRVLEKYLKQSEKADKRMCSKCHKVHTDKQPNQNISFVCDDCVERV